MKKVFVVLFAIVALQVDSFAQCVVPSSVYSFTYGGKNYEVIKEQKPWANAAACAVERGGYLAEINTLSEQTAIYDAIINGAGVSATYTTINNGGGIAYVWIGATDQQTEGTWLWDGNNDNTGTNFWTGQGANGTNNGTAVGGAYYNWGGTSTGTPKEPDNYGTGQHHAAIALAGWPSGTTYLGIASEWNDIIGSSQLYFVVEYDSGTALPKHTVNTTLTFYPNPSNGLVTLSSSKPILRIEIIDLSGQTVYAESALQASQTLDLSALKKGIYLVQLYDGESWQTEKLILQ